MCVQLLSHMICGVLCLTISTVGGIRRANDEQDILESLASPEESIRQQGRAKLLTLLTEDPNRALYYIKHKQPAVAIEVAKALGNLPSQRATELLVDLVLGGEDPAIVSIAAAGLRSRRLDRNQLLQLLKIDDPSVLRVVFTLLEAESTVDADLLEGLRQRLLFDRRWYIRRDAAGVLTRAKGLSNQTRCDFALEAMRKECIEPTLEPNKPDTEGRATPISDILKAAYRQALIAAGKEVVRRISDEVNREKGEMRRQLVIVLGSLGHAGAYKELVEIASEDPNPWNRRAAILALKELGNPAAIPVLKKALQDPFYVQRSCIIPPAGFEEYAKIYPVRDAAFAGLLKLGVKVQRVGANRYEVLDKVGD